MINAMLGYKQGKIHSAEFSDEFNKLLDCVSDTAAAEMRAAYKVGFKDGVILIPSFFKF